MQMANLINSMTNDKLNPLNGDSVSLKELGKLAKIVSEIKLIEGFQPIKVTASRDIFINQKPAQLLEARTIDNKGFSLIIENKNTSIEGIKQVGLDMDSKNNSFKLSFIEPNTNPAPSNKAINNINQNRNLEEISQKNNNINKHYSDAINPPPNQVKRATLMPNPNRTERLVHLASKVEYLSILAKVATQSPPIPKALDSPRETAWQTQASERNVSHKPSLTNHSVVINPAQVQNKTTQNKDTTRLPEVNTVNKRSINPQANNNSIPPPEIKIPSKTSIEDKVPPMTARDAKVEPKSDTQVQSSNHQISDKYKVITQSDFTQNSVSNTPAQVKQTDAKATLTLEPRGQVNTPIEKNQKTQTIDQANSTQYRVSKEAGEFILASEVPLKVGDKIQIFTDSLGNIQLLPKQTVVRESTLNGEFAKSLPQQITKNELVQLIQNLSKIQGSEKLDNNTQKLIQQLLTSIPQRQDLDTPKAIKQAIFNSGLFLENKLLNNPVNLTQDIKANWLNFQTVTLQNPMNESAVQTSIKESVAQTSIKESVAQASIKEILDLKTGEAISQAVERITSSQIRNLLESNKLDALNFPLVIELPIQDKGSTSIFQLQIDRDKETESKSTKKKKWLAKLLFDFPETGKFEARLNVEGNKVSVIFVAEDKDTDSKIRKRGRILTKQLQDKGLEVSQLDSFSKPIERQTNNTKKHSLIDVRS